MGTDWRSLVTSRIAPTLAAGLTIGAGLGVRAVLDGQIANVGGVALWATLISCIVAWVQPTIPAARLFAWTVLVSFSTELFQLTGVPMTLYRIHPLFALVFGTTFQWADLPAYVLGAALGGGMQQLWLGFGHRTAAR